MKHKLWIGLIGLLLIAGCAGTDITGDAVEPEDTRQPIATGTTGRGDVQITLTPGMIRDGRLEVDIAADTHSVDLSQYDLREQTTLRAGGEMIKPVEAPRLSGHHSYGTLAFELDNAESYTIVIEGIPDVERREFTW